MSFLFYIKNYLIRKFSDKETCNKSLFDHHFFTNQYYLHKTASLNGISKILNINQDEVDKIALKHYGSNFHALCDHYKFQHFWSEFNNPLNSDLPVESIINIAGFNSNDEFSKSINKHKEESIYILEKKFI